MVLRIGGQQHSAARLAYALRHPVRMSPSASVGPVSGAVAVVARSDDDRVFLTRALDAAGLDVAWAVASALEALRLLEVSPPDVLLTETTLQGSMDGPTLATMARARRNVGCVFMAGVGDELSRVERALRTKPLGILLKPIAAEQLVATVRVALASSMTTASGTPAKEVAASPQSVEAIRVAPALVATEATRGFTVGRASEAPDGLAWIGLTPREREVVRLLRANRRTDMIASSLGLSRHTVRNHLKAVFRKLGVHSQSQLLQHLD